VMSSSRMAAQTAESSAIRSAPDESPPHDEPSTGGCTGHQASLLGAALEQVITAASLDDVVLADASRRLVAALQQVLERRDGSPEPEPDPTPGEPEEADDAALLSTPSPPEPPAWAKRRFTEDDGIVYEVLSPVRPTIVGRGPFGWGLQQVDVSLSTRDVLLDGHWIRTRPTVQVENGTYTVEGVQDLREALADLLNLVDGEETDVG